MNNTYYKEKLKTLPDDLQYAVMMSEWQKTLLKIKDKFKLHIDQTQTLEDCTIKLMFGDIDAPDFINIMFNDAHINSETAADILLEIDLTILKEIRHRLESMEEIKKRDEKLDYLLLSDEDKIAREISDLQGDYYENIEKVYQETEEQMLKEGILPDGSNITDEMLGITTEIPSDIVKEKDDLLKEIDSPTINIYKKETFSNAEPIPVDHQLQNIHIEEPFQEEDIVSEQIETETITQTEAPQTEEQTSKEIPTEIKKPITIKLDDMYREPIE